MKIIDGKALSATLRAELKIKIECELRTLNELYDFYLEKLEEEPYNSYYESRLNEMRIQIRTYEKVLEMVK